MILDLCDEGTEMYALTTDEERAKGKPFMAWTLQCAGDALLSTPGFSWDCLGTNGDKLVEHRNAHKYEEHHDLAVELCSVDNVNFIGGTPFMLTMQYGRIEDAKKKKASEAVPKFKQG